MRESINSESQKHIDGIEETNILGKAKKKKRRSSVRILELQKKLQTQNEKDQLTETERSPKVRKAIKRRKSLKILELQKKYTPKNVTTAGHEPGSNAGKVVVRKKKRRTSIKIKELQEMIGQKKEVESKRPECEVGALSTTERRAFFEVENESDQPFKCSCGRMHISSWWEVVSTKLAAGHEREEMVSQEEYSAFVQATNAESRFPKLTHYIDEPTTPTEEKQEEEQQQEETKSISHNIDEPTTPTEEKKEEEQQQEETKSISHNIDEPTTPTEEKQEEQQQQKETKSISHDIDEPSTLTEAKQEEQQQQQQQEPKSRNIDGPSTPTEETHEESKTMPSYVQEKELATAVSASDDEEGTDLADSEPPTANALEPEEEEEIPSYLQEIGFMTAVGTDSASNDEEEEETDPEDSQSSHEANAFKQRLKDIRLRHQDVAAHRTASHESDKSLMSPPRTYKWRKGQACKSKESPGSTTKGSLEAALELELPGDLDVKPARTGRRKATVVMPTRPKHLSYIYDSRKRFYGARRKSVSKSKTLHQHAFGVGGSKALSPKSPPVRKVNPAMLTESVAGSIKQNVGANAELKREAMRLLAIVKSTMRRRNISSAQLFYRMDPGKRNFVTLKQMTQGLRAIMKIKFSTKQMSLVFNFLSNSSLTISWKNFTQRFKLVRSSTTVTSAKVCRGGKDMGKQRETLTHTRRRSFGSSLPVATTRTRRRSFGSILPVTTTRSRRHSIGSTLPGMRKQRVTRRRSFGSTLPVR